MADLDKIADLVKKNLKNNFYLQFSEKKNCEHLKIHKNPKFWTFPDFRFKQLKA